MVPMEQAQPSHPKLLWDVMESFLPAELLACRFGVSLIIISNLEDLGSELKEMY